MAIEKEYILLSVLEKEVIAINLGKMKSADISVKC